MLSTVKVFFLDIPGGKRDSGLPVNELRFEKDIVTITGSLKPQDILNHVYEVKTIIQKLYTQSYCPYFRLIYRFGDSTTGTIVTEEYNSLKEVKKIEFKSEEEFEKHNISKKELKERKEIQVNRPKSLSKEDLKEVTNDIKSEPLKDEAKKSSSKRTPAPLKQETSEADKTNTLLVNPLDEKYKNMDESDLTKKKLSLQSKRSRLKKEGYVNELPDIEKEISYINALIKAKFIYNT